MKRITLLTTLLLVGLLSIHATFAPVRAASHAGSEALKKQCHIVTKKVHGKKQKVKVCSGPKATPTPIPTPTPDTALFKEMYYLALDHEGNLYADDTMNFDRTSGRNRILKLSPSGAVLQVLGGLPTGKAPGQFEAPNGLGIDSHDNLFVADVFNDRIQEFSPSGQVLPGWGALDSPSGQLGLPYGLAVDAQDNVYVAEFQEDRISKFSPEGKLVMRIPLSFDPFDVAVSRDGTIYVSSPHVGGIGRYTQDGKSLGGWPVSADGIAVDAQGNVFAAVGTEGAEELSPEGKVLRTWNSSTINDPRLKGMSTLGIAVDSSSNVYVSDAAPAHKQIIKFSPSGQILAIWK